MDVRRDGDKLTFSTGHGSPWGKALLTGAFVAAVCGGVFAVHLYFALVQDWRPGWFAVILCPVLALGFVVTTLRNHHATVVVDPRYNRIEIERRYLHRTERERLRLADVAKMDIEVTKDSDGDEQFQPVLHMKDGRKVALAPVRSRRSGLFEAAKAFNDLRA